MKAQQHKIALKKAHEDACPKCARHSLVDSHWVISVTLDSLISGALAMMSIMWVGYCLGVDPKVSSIAAVLASIPFICALIKKKICRHCEIEFSGDAKNENADDDYEELL